jgi:seryl-tRNA synthetase
VCKNILQEDVAMHDIKFIRENPAQFDAQLARRGLAAQSSIILQLDAQRRALQTEAQQLLEQRNAASKEIGAAKAAKDEAKAASLMATVNALKEKLPAIEAEERTIAAELDAILSSLPNLPAADTPDGKDEHDNVEILKHGTPRVFDFTPQPHETLGEKLGLLSAETAAKLSGSRFVVLRGALAKLERVLAQFMLNTLTEEFGYEEVSPPLLVRDHALYGTGQLPKFGEDLFKTTTDL